MAKANLIILTDPHSAQSEAYRTLRTNLMFSRVDKALHTLAVSSTVESDDKSTVIANLATSFAQAGNKTVLVDCDLRRPMQHEIWGVENTRGLTTMMQEDIALSTPPLVSTEVPNLSLLPSGAVSVIASDFLSSPRMNEIIGVLKARADYVLFDVPPVLAAADAVLLGSKVDGVLLVIRANSTRRDYTLQARQALERAHVALLGAVLTNAPRERASRYGK